MVRNLLFAVWLMLPLAAFAGDLETPHISVTGSAEKELPPDSLVWNIQVLSLGSDLQEVTGRHAARCAELMAFLKEQGLPREKIKTDYTQFGQVWNYSQSRGRFFDGYRASTAVTFTTTDFATYGGIWAGLAGIEDVAINGVTRQIEDYVEARNALRVEALKAAQKKADVMAKTLGMRIGRPIAIEENSDEAHSAGRSRYSNVSYEAPVGEDMQESFAPGMVKLKVSVAVTFSLLN